MTCQLVPVNQLHGSYLTSLATRPKWNSLTGVCGTSVSSLVTSSRPLHFAGVRGPRQEAPSTHFAANQTGLLDIKNWCPGRSILRESNAWLNEFASMQESEGVRAAIQCLAGTYVYDYSPTAELARRINGLFEIAEHELSVLLNRFRLVDVLPERESNELVAIASMLSMQDVGSLSS
jgi:hypothetical protein